MMQSRRWKKLFIFNLRWRGGIIIALPVVCLVTAILMIAGLRLQTIEARNQEQKTRKILETTNDLLFALQKAEAEVRGYSLTENDKFLRNYQEVQKTINQEYDQLQMLVKNTSQEEKEVVAKIEQLARRQNQQLEQMIKLVREEETFPPQVNFMNENLLRSEQQFQSLERAIEAFIEQQETSQQQLELIVQSWANRTTQVQWIALIVGLGATIGGIYLFINLERQVSQYTDRIEESNAYLARTSRTLEKRNQELDQFAYIVSHDLKAPLRAIANLSSWIEEDIGENLDTDTQYQMDLLRKRVHRMEAFINGILEYSRVGRVRSERETINVENLLKEIINSLEIPEEFTVEIGSNMPTITTETLPLQQVFTNLITNAIKHHDRADGKVSITVKERENAYEFTVTDDGTGIDPKFHEKIFIMFQTLQARDTVENTGVGLAIIKKIMDDKGEKITVESEPGKGTSFHFTWSKSKISSEEETSL